MSIMKTEEQENVFNYTFLLVYDLELIEVERELPIIVVKEK